MSQFSVCGDAGNCFCLYSRPVSSRSSAGHCDTTLHGPMFSKLFSCYYAPQIIIKYKPVLPRRQPGDLVCRTMADRIVRILLPPWLVHVVLFRGEEIEPG